MAKDYYKQIRTILYSSESDEVKKDQLDSYHANDIANVVEHLSKTERIKLYRIIGVDRTAEVFSYLDNVDDYVAELDYDKAADIIERMDADDAVDVLDELEDEDKDQIFNRMEKESREDVKLISSYHDDQIGSKMTTNFITIEKDSTITSAMKELVSQAAENDNIQTIYVLNPDDTLYGIIDLKDLIIARKNQSLEDIILTNYPSVLDTALVSETINEIRDYDMDSVPVITKDKQLVGVITSSDIIESVDDELSDDYAKLAGLSEEDDLHEPLGKSIKKRLPWLVILMFLGLVVSTVTGQFEWVIALLPALVAFQSMVLDMAGNVGTQSLAVTIRYISDGDKEKKSSWKIIWHEIKIGLLNGLILGVLCAIFISIYLGIRHTNVYAGTEFNWHDCFKAGGIVGLSLFTSMFISAFTGSYLPILLTKMHIDPAVASGPFITTINDLIAITIYYGLAAILFLAI